MVVGFGFGFARDWIGCWVYFLNFWEEQVGMFLWEKIMKVKIIIIIIDLRPKIIIIIIII